MGRREVYCIDEKQQIYFTRWELDGQPVEVTEKQTITHYHKKDYPTQVIRWTGLHLVKYGNLPEQRVLGSMIYDAGLAGISAMSDRAPEVPYTPEERAAGREQIRQAVERIFGCRCHWKDEADSSDVDKSKGRPLQAV